MTESQSQGKPEESRSQRSAQEASKVLCEAEALHAGGYTESTHGGCATVPSCSCILILSDKARRFTVTLRFYPHCIFNAATLEHSELSAVPGVQPPVQPECTSHRFCLFSTASGNCLSWASVLLCPSISTVWILPKPV